jgi:hypothetical protein
MESILNFLRSTLRRTYCLSSCSSILPNIRHALKLKSNLGRLSKVSSGLTPTKRPRDHLLNSLPVTKPPCSPLYPPLSTRSMLSSEVTRCQEDNLFSILKMKLLHKEVLPYIHHACSREGRLLDWIESGRKSAAPIDALFCRLLFIDQFSALYCKIITEITTFLRK